MLRFAAKPDKVFEGIVDEALEWAGELLKDGLKKDDGVVFDRCFSMFDKATLLREVEKLRDAHRSPKLFMPTEYHWLILWEALYAFVIIRNDFCHEHGYNEKKGLWGAFGGVKIKDIDFGWMADAYFWDTDFLLSQNVINEMTGKDKKGMGFSDGLFGIANRLSPHEDDLALKECKEMQEPLDERIIKTGEDYPYYDDREEA